MAANDFQILYDVWSSSRSGALRIAGSFTAVPSTSAAQLITTAPGVTLMVSPGSSGFAVQGSFTAQPSTSAAQLITTAGTAINVAPSTSGPVFPVSFALPVFVAPASSAPTFVVDGSGVTQPVSAVSLPLPTGAAKDSTLTNGTQIAQVAPTTSGPVFGVSVTNFPGTQPISGAVSVTNFPASQQVTVTAPVGVAPSSSNPTFPVSIAATVTVQPSSLQAVSVSNFPSTQAVTGTVSVVSTSSGQPLPVAVIGTVTTTPSSQAGVSVVNFPSPQLVAPASSGPTFAVSGAVTVTGSVTATPSSTPSAVTIQPASSAPSFAVTGTFFQGTQPVSIAATVVTQPSSLQAVTVQPASSGPTFSVTVGNFPVTQPVSGTVAATQGTIPWQVAPSTSGPVFQISGSITTSPSTSAGQLVVTGATPLTVQPSSSPWAIAGTVTAVPSSTPSAVTIQPASSGPTFSVTVGNFPTTQAVSGTVAATQGTTPWQVAPSTSGPTFQVSGTVTAVPSTSSGQLIVTGASALKVDGSAVTQPTSLAVPPPVTSISTTWSSSFAVNSRLTLPVSGYATATVSESNGTGDGSGIFEASNDGGVTWFPIAGSPTNSTDYDNYVSTLFLGLGEYGYTLEVGGYTHLSVRLNPVIANGGTAAITLSAGQSGAHHALFTGTVNKGFDNLAHNFGWWVRPTDGTNDMRVIPPSTAASSSAESIVVALTPNTPLPAGTNTLGTVKVVGASSGVTFPVTATPSSSPWAVTVQPASSSPTFVVQQSSAFNVAGTVSVVSTSSGQPLPVSVIGTLTTQPSSTPVAVTIQPASSSPTFGVAPYTVDGHNILVDLTDVLPLLVDLRTELRILNMVHAQTFIGTIDPGEARGQDFFTN